MKSDSIAARFARILVTGALALGTAFGNTSLDVPTGTITASPGLVRQGTFPTITWDIQYPSVVKDYVEIIPPSTVNPKEKLDMEIRVLGAGVTVSNSNGTNLSFVPTEASFSYNGGSYQRIFYGTNWDVDPNKVVHSRRVDKNRALRFGGRYYYSNSWGPFYSSSGGTQNVRTLVSGQVPPTTYPLHTAPSLESFLKPYLDGSGRVMIGPMDVIVFMELTHTDSQSYDQGYDLQDMVLLVSFKPVK